MGKIFAGIRFLVYFLIWLFVWYFVLDLFLGFTLPVLQGRGRTSVVPDLTGIPVEKAKAIAEEKGLRAVVDTAVPSVNAPAGVVIGQEPTAGTEVKRGRTVYLTVSLGAKSKIVPDIVGMALEEAITSLKDIGFSVKVEPLYSCDKEPGYVERMHPPPGSSLPIGSTITLYYSEEFPDTLWSKVCSGVEDAE